MTIESCLVEQFLPDTPDKMFEVRHPSGQLAFTANRREALALCKSRYVSGEVNKHNYLRYLRLSVSVHAAISLVRRFRRPPVGSNLTITKPVQSGVHWKPRYDRAQNSRASRERSRYTFDHSANTMVSEICVELPREIAPKSYLQKLKDLGLAQPKVANA